MIRGPDLRSTINRKLDIAGAQLGVDYTIDNSRMGVTLSGIQVDRGTQEDPRSLWVNEGETVWLTTLFDVSVQDRVLFARVNPELHRYGLIQDVQVYDESDGVFRPRFRFEAERDTDLSVLRWFIKFYITE